MKILSVNISEPQTIIINGKSEQTGYFKKPVDAICLGKTDVKNDSVIDREHHGGEDKACYLFGYNHYKFWKELYPNAEYDFGMFGENITIEHLDESTLKIGDTFQLGEAVIQITQPRQPCYKMGVKFNDQKVVNSFRLAHTPGIYVRVLKEGNVVENDEMYLMDSYENAPTVLEVYRIIYNKKPSENELEKIITNTHIAEQLKHYLKKKFNL